MVNVAQMNFEDQVMTEEVKPSEPPFYLMRPPPGINRLLSTHSFAHY